MKANLTKLLHEYIEWCDELYDHNWPVPRFVDPSLNMYEVTGDIRLVKRREEPSIRGFLKWLETKEEV